MKSSLLLLVLFSLAFLSHAQTPDLIWQHSYGGSKEDYTRSIQLTADGGFAFLAAAESADGDVVGNHGLSDYWLVKVNAEGIQEWQKCFGGSLDDYGYEMKVTADGGYIIAGYTNSHDGDVSDFLGNFDYWVVKTDANGNIEWEQSYGGTGYDAPYAVEQTTDHGYVVAGSVVSHNGDVTGFHLNKDLWVIKIDSAGTLQWQKDVGGSGIDDAFAIQQTTDGGYIVAGNTESTDGDVIGLHGSDDFWVVKLSASGNLLWQHCYGGSASEKARSVRQKSDGGYVVLGYTASTDGDVTGNHGKDDMWVIGIDSLGNLQWQKTFGGSDADFGRVIHIANDGSLLIAGASKSFDGDVTGNHGDQDFWIAGLDASHNITWQKSFGGSLFDYAYAFEQSGGEYYLGGLSKSNDGDVTGNHGEQDAWITKLCIAPTSTDATISADGSASFCSGGSVTLSTSTSGFTYLWSNGATTMSINVSSSGIYNCTVSNSCGSILSNSLTVTVNEAPTVLQSTISAAGVTTFCAEGTVVLTVATAGLTYQWKKDNADLSGATLQNYTANASGSFSCDVSNECGTTVSNSIVVTENPKPTATVSAAACSGGTVLLTCTAVPNTGVKYKWKKDGSSISGATNSTYTATQSGSYKCTVTITATGCKKTSKAVTVTINCKEGSVSLLQEAFIYPNPTSNYFVINTSQLDVGSVITINDLTGKELERYDANGEEIKAGSSLPNGMYIATVIKNGEIMNVMKLVKSN